jgi:hypothetical protein
MKKTHVMNIWPTCVIGIIAAAILCSCATIRLANQGNVRSPIGQASYRIVLPNDADWKDWAVSTKSERETVLFETLRTWPFTGEVLGKISIAVMKNEAAPARWQFTEEQIADEILTLEERTMIEQGVQTRKYSLYDVTRDTVTVGGKQLYRMSYGTSQGGAVGEAVLCVYIPASYRDTHAFYEFLISGTFKKLSGYHIDFDSMVPVIEGFQLVQ